MAERWVSVGKKYCDICKCWFADNRASIEFHERGDKHRNALAQKLKDVGRQRELKLHAEINIKGQLAAMQAGAMLQMKKYGEESTEGPVTGVQGSRYFDPRQAGQDVSAMAAEMARLADQRKNGQYRRPEAPSGPVPVRINKEALAKAQKHARLEAERKARKKAKLEMEKEKQKFIDEAAKDTKKETKEWVQAETEEGQTYYWHMYTGETIWEAPPEFFTPIEYEIYLATLEAEREIVHNFDLAESEQREMADGEVNAQAQADYEQYYGSDQLPDSSEYLLEIKKKKDKGVKRPRHRLPKAQPVPLPGSLYAPGAIGFTKQAISGRLNDVEDVNSIPMPLFEPGTEPKMEIQELEEEPQVQNFVTQEPEPERIVDTNTGYGGWTKVVKKEAAEPIFSPLTARYRELEELEKKEAAEAAANPPVVKKEEKEEKVEFTEKVATVKTKGKVEFKKRTGITKNIRQRVG